MIFDGDRSKLGEYVRSLADVMGLRDWHINLMHDPPDDPEHAACVDVRYGRRVVNVHFHPSWAQNEPETLRSTCVHELLHCHLKPTEWAINNASGALGMVGFTILHGSYMDALEVAIDSMATAWAETLPLPIEYAENVEEGVEL